MGAAQSGTAWMRVLRLEYSSFEVIVVNDGSTDATAEIVDKYPVRLISTENRGLSSARNVGLEAATGEIVAYLDDDACPDPPGLLILRPPSSIPPMQPWAPQTFHRLATGRSLIVWRMRLAAQRMSSFLIERQSTFPAATWRSAKLPSKRSAALTRNSVSPVMTSMFVGGCRNKAGRWGSTPLLWSGIIAAARCGPIGNNN